MKIGVFSETKCFGQKLCDLVGRSDMRDLQNILSNGFVGQSVHFISVRVLVRYIGFYSSPSKIPKLPLPFKPI